MKIRLVKDTRISCLNKKVIQSVDFECEVPKEIGAILVRKERAIEIEEFTADIEVVETSDMGEALKEARTKFESDFKEELEQFDTDKETLKTENEELETAKGEFKTTVEELNTAKEQIDTDSQTLADAQTQYGTDKEALTTDQAALKTAQDELVADQKQLADDLKAFEASKKKTKK